GEKTETSSRTIAELLRETNAPDSGVAVALNGDVVRRGEWESTALKDNDEIEIIRAVQGG
ncbi:MAG TPA: sulfur carrier protein ThiS, partial [Abditibacteriaceae bacterium]